MSISVQIANLNLNCLEEWASQTRIPSAQIAEVLLSECFPLSQLLLKTLKGHLVQGEVLAAPAHPVPVVLVLQDKEVR